MCWLQEYLQIFITLRQLRHFPIGPRYSKKRESGAESFLFFLRSETFTRRVPHHPERLGRFKNPSFSLDLIVPWQTAAQHLLIVELHHISASVETILRAATWLFLHNHLRCKITGKRRPQRPSATALIVLPSELPDAHG